jgi:mycothione reductase
VTTEQFDLIIIGTGSGNSLITPEMDGWRIAIIERDLFGGTCLNRGCIPSKMLIYAADVAESAAAPTNAAKYGVSTSFVGADWPAIVNRVIAEGGRQYRHSLPNVVVYEGDGRFVGERELEVNGVRLRGDRVVIAAGAQSVVPDIPGLAEAPFHTSDTILRIPVQPRHLIVLGGGFIASELGHVFRSLGSQVTMVNRGKYLLQAEDADISQRFTEVAGERFDLVMGVQVERVEQIEGGVAVHVRDASGTRIIEGDTLLVATGRVSNGAELRCDLAGVDLDAKGNVIVDAFGRTTADNVWALGDVNGRHQLKHMANGEAKVVQHNLLHPDQLRPLDDRPAPHAVFTSPQIGSVGVTEAAARSGADPFCVITHDYGGAAYGWALEDTTSFCKLIGNPVTRQLTGAHVIGYQASILVQLLVQGMHLGTSVDDMATGQIWIHPALSEVVEVALLKLMEAFDAHDSAASHPS